MNTESVSQIDAGSSASNCMEVSLCEVTDCQEAVTTVSAVSPVISPAISQAHANGREQPTTDPMAGKSCNKSGNESGNRKPNCYVCKHRRELVGDCHSSCAHVGASPIALLLFAAGQTEMMTKQIHVRGNTHGVRSGWFMWPMNFDPTWLEICSGFEPTLNEAR